MDTELPAKREASGDAEAPEKRPNAPLVTEEEWEPYAEVLKNLDWSNEQEHVEAKKQIAEKMTTVEGLKEIMDRVQEKISQREPAAVSNEEEDAEFEALDVVQQIKELYSRVFT